MKGIGLDSNVDERVGGVIDLGLALKSCDVDGGFVWALL